MPIPSSDNYDIGIYVNGSRVHHNSYIVCGGGDRVCEMTIKFTFVEMKKTGLAVPLVRVVGDGHFVLNQKKHANNVYHLESNTQYEGIATMRKIGRMTIMFSWESGSDFHQGVVVNVDNY